MFGNFRFRKLVIILAFSLAMAGLSGQAWAQIRLYGKVQPNPDGATNPLVFDVNADSTDNISPNIVLTSDSARGFVAYTGSGVVLEFSVATGEVLNRITTGGRPFYATPLPDNNRLAIVSVLDNRIFIVDMNSNPSGLVATYTFANASFGFGGIITLSPDGNIGYVSSTGTGEVIKFSMLDGHEITRLKGMRFPAQITVTPDSATLIVVDTDPGTPELVFADTATMTKRASLKNPNPTTDVVVFTIFNKPVLAPDGKTGIMASRGQNNVLYKERVFLFDAANGTLLKTGDTGPGPGFTGITPDGKNWVIMNMFSITVIPTDDFDKLQEFQGASGDAIGSANVAFSPDSRYGYYAASAHDVIFQIDLENGAILDQILIGDNPDTLLEQPASMAVTNDGKSIVALEFISGNLDLFTPTTRIAAARFLSSPDTFTGLSLINLSSKQNVVTVFAMQDFGELNQEEGVTNPVKYTLEPNQQISITIAELFNFDDNNAPNGERTGWIAIYADQPEVTGYLSIGKKDLSYLSGLALETRRVTEAILPEIDRTGDQEVNLSTLNATYYQMTFDMQRVAHDGTVIDVLTSQPISGNARLGQALPDLFPRTSVETEGYLYMNAPAGLNFSEIYNNAASIEAITGIDLSSYAGVTRVFSPQFATVPGWRTTLNLINANTAEADVTVTLHGPDGIVIGEPYQKHFKRGEQLKDDLVNLFSDPAAQSAAGWLEVESTQDSIVGTVTFHGDADNFVASYELSGTPLSQFIFPTVAQSEGYYTGLALLNSGSEAAHVVFELWDKDGNIVKTSDPLTLAPKSRIAAYLNSLFQNSDLSLVSNLRVRSDKPLYSFALVNDAGFNFLMPVLPVPLF